MKLSIIASAAAVAALASGGIAVAALDTSSSQHAHSRPAVPAQFAGDTWSYAGNVFGHQNCWQVSAGDGLSALFTCNDGNWLDTLRTNSGVLSDSITRWH